MISTPAARKLGTLTSALQESMSGEETLHLTRTLLRSSWAEGEATGSFYRARGWQRQGQLKCQTGEQSGSHRSGCAEQLIRRNLIRTAAAVPEDKEATEHSMEQHVLSMPLFPTLV